MLVYLRLVITTHGQVHVREKLKDWGLSTYFTETCRTMVLMAHIRPKPLNTARWAFPGDKIVSSDPSSDNPTVSVVVALSATVIGHKKFDSELLVTSSCPMPATSTSLLRRLFLFLLQLEQLQQDLQLASELECYLKVCRWHAPSPTSGGALFSRPPDSQDSGAYGAECHCSDAAAKTKGDLFVLVFSGVRLG